MRTVVVCLAVFAVGGWAAPAQFSISISQPLRVQTPFTVTISAISSNPAPAGLGGSFTLDGEPIAPTATLGNGVYSFVCQSAGIRQFGFHYGGDTNYDPSSTFVNFEVQPKIATSVSIPAANPPNPSAGQLFELSAIATASEGAASGYVAFFDNGSLIAYANRSELDKYSAMVSLGLGTHRLSASYLVTGPYENSVSDPLTLVIARSATNMNTLTVSGSPRFGQPVTFTATITPAASGPVTFHDGATEIGTVLLSNGTASLTTSSLAIGSHDISARYAGTADFAPSSSPVLRQTVKGLPIITLTASPNPSPNVPIEFMATVRIPTPQAPAVTGPIELREGTNSLGTLPLTITLPIGEHTLTAVYAGGTLYEPATSAPLTLRVTGSAPSSTAIDLRIGETAALTIRVSTASPNGPTPTGTVRVNDSSLALANGSATIADARALLGRRVTAEYSGDAIHSASSAANHLVLAPLNGFSFAFGPLAPSQIVTVFGDSLDKATVQIGGQPASIYFSSATQTTFALPDSIPDSPATLTILNGQGQAFSGSASIARTAPGIATATADGQGPPAAQLLRLRSGNARTESLQGPIVFNGDDVYLILYGTGFRHAASPVTCTGAGRTLTALYAGPQGDYPGLDQINLPLDTALTHAGTVALTCTADGRTSNAVSLQFP